MDAATASIIVAGISAAASVAVAIITTRSKIGPPPIEHTSPAAVSVQHDRPERPSSFRKNRAIGWALVGFLYLMSAALIFIAGAGYLAVYQLRASVEDLGLVSGIFVAGAFFVAVGFWAQKRLRPNAN